MAGDVCAGGDAPHHYCRRRGSAFTANIADFTTATHFGVVGIWLPTADYGISVGKVFGVKSLWVGHDVGKFSIYSYFNPLRL